MLPISLTHQFADRLPELAHPWRAEPCPSAQLVVLNESLATDLGLDSDELAAESGVDLLSGAKLPASARPVAQAYSGHQFGGFSPLLGDGRALLLGELEAVQGLVDVHLKGSGATPFARGGADGRATLGPMLRELIVSEAMHALGVPTTRSLAVLTTGRPVFRHGREPGAMRRAACVWAHSNTQHCAAMKRCCSGSPTTPSNATTPSLPIPISPISACCVQ